MLKAKPWTEALVLEMGVDHRGEMDNHLSLVQPQIGVVTGISPVHSEKNLLGSLEGIIEEKQKLISSLPKDGLAVLNYDDENVRKMAKISSAKVIYYGQNERNCDVWGSEIRVDINGLSFLLHHGTKILKVFTGLVGSHHVYTCLAAYAVGNYLGITDEKIIAGLKELLPLSGRLSLEKGPLGTVLINDTRRANPSSTIAGLITLNDLPGKRKIAVLGEMGELGEYAKSEHRKVGLEAAKLNLDCLIGVGPLTKFLLEGAKDGGLSQKKIIYVENVIQATDELKKILKKDDLLYLKGSLLRHMERIIYLLKAQRVDCCLVSCHRYESCSTCSKLINNLK
jgi:UDP-N-acetylmuramoyl-tripeptide--D-alanyl-D-alanine ligase